MRPIAGAWMLVGLMGWALPGPVAAASRTVVKVTVVPPSSAPASIGATAANGQVALTWGAVPGATAYNVYRGAGGVWEPAAIARVKTPTFRNYGLVNGTTYTYRVTGLNSGGSGPASADVSATPLAQPTGLVALAGDARVTLSWNAVAGATSYAVLRGASSTLDTMTPLGTRVAVPTVVDMGLTNGTRYYYRVRAFSADSASAVSASVSAKPLPPPPATAPATLTATAGNLFITLNWSAVEGATGYRLYRSTTGTWETTPLVSTSKTTYKNTALTSGVTYTYKVAAYGPGGTGPASTTVSATPLAPPLAPAGLTAVAGDAMVTLQWTPDPAATTYNVYRGTRPGGEARVAVASGLTAPSFEDRGLQNGPTYYYKVTGLNGGGESPRSEEVNGSPEGPPPAVDPATLDAFRFLRQTTWGPRPGDVDALKALGKDAFLASQLSAPPSTYPDSLFGMSLEATQEHFMSLALTGPDQLRLRVAWALHKIWVVSGVEVDSPRAIVTYQRLLLNGAFGNYRDLMRDITLNPAMGRYLNMLNNRSQAVTGVPPNENFARELMQLFTLGIATLNADGTPQVGAPPSYTEQDVKELARILTGWTFGDGNPTTVPTRLARENYGVPMEPVARYHDSDAKTFLGEEFPAGRTAQQDLDQALDLIFRHANVAPFISRQLIQQLVTSNPSQAYVADVAAVFDGAGGARGDLTAVVRAILTHPEASVSTNTSGKLSEPALFVVSVLRGLNAVVTDHPFMSDKSEAMGQKVFYPPSVFSYFSPSYRVRGTSGPAGPLTGPEFQGLTTVTALERVNFVGALLGGHFGADVAIDYAPFTSRAADPAALVDYCSLLFMGGRMSIEERAELISAVRATSASNAPERVRTALYLTLTAAQAQVDR
ncbi:MAG: DUF1800 family protein [Vicinamibacterales bacterium]